MIMTTPSKDNDKEDSPADAAAAAAASSKPKRRTSRISSKSSKAASAALASVSDVDVDDYNDNDDDDDGMVALLPETAAAVTTSTTKEPWLTSEMSRTSDSMMWSSSRRSGDGSSGRRRGDTSRQDHDNSNSSSHYEEDDSQGDLLSIASDAALAPTPNPNRYAPPRIMIEPCDDGDDHDHDQDIEKALLPRTTASFTSNRNNAVYRDQTVVMAENGKLHLGTIGKGQSCRSIGFDSSHTKTTAGGSSIDDTYSTSSKMTSTPKRKTGKEMRQDNNNNNNKMTSDQTIVEEPTSNNINKAVCCGFSRCTLIIFGILALAGFVLGFALTRLKPQPHQQRPKPQILSPDDPALQDFFVHTNNNDDKNESIVTYATYNPLHIGQSQRPPVLQVPSINVWTLFDNETIVLPNLLQSVEDLANGVTFNDSHLTKAAQLFVQSVIHRNVMKPVLRLEKTKPQQSATDEYVVPFMDTPLRQFDGQMPYPTAPRGISNDRFPHGDVAMWEECLRVNGIHESDETLQIDSTHGILYVSRGDHVDLIDTNTGAVRSTIVLPPSATSTEDPPAKDSWFVPVESDERPGWQPAPPTPFIERLLLTSTFDYLIVIVSNYESIRRARVKPLLKESLVTQIFTYRLRHAGNVTEWELVNKKPHSVHGRVLYAAHAEHNQHIHIVTASEIDTSRLLEDPLERLYYPDRDDRVYVDEVLRLADERYIPLYVKRLRDEIRALEGVSTLFPLIQWVAGNSESEVEQHLAHTVMAQSHLQELIVITSLSITNTSSESVTSATRQAAEPLSRITTRVVQTAFLGPSGVGVTGSTDTLITLTIPGYKWTDARVLEEATHFLQLELGTINKPGSIPLAATRYQGLGMVPGRLVQSSRQATYRHGHDLRIATVVDTQWRVGVTEEGEAMIEESRVRESYLHVLDSHTLTHRVGSMLKLEETKLASVTFLSNVAFAFPLQPLSSSMVNKTSIRVIEFDQPSDERTESHALRMVASVEPNLQGFSPNLHPLPSIDDKKIFLMSIGQNVTSSGVSMGWMVSVWDATDASKLVPVIQHSIEVPNTITNWTPKTFRMTPSGQLILPVTVQSVGVAASVESNSPDMTGFIVLNVSALGVEEVARVPHIGRATSSSDCTPGDGDCPLGGASFWMNSALLTVGGTSARLTTVVSDVDAETQTEWSQSLP